MRSFALNPDEGPPRLFRFVYDLPDEVIATLDEKNNLLRINRPLFEQLSEHEQASVLRTHAVTTEVIAAF